jgi:predicted Zn-ribbon and HTH transcriptional regulator
MEMLTASLYSARQLANFLGLPERQIEDHLVHIVRSLKRDQTRRFCLEPAACRDCDFVFRDRARLTRPSRCPRCRSESIAPPRYGIQVRPSTAG